jgi:hypothetical protein
MLSAQGYVAGYISLNRVKVNGASMENKLNCGTKNTKMSAK